MEEERFQRTDKQGLREFGKLINRLGKDVKVIDGPSAFRLYDTFGFPLEFTRNWPPENGYTVDVEGFEKASRHHQKSHRPVLPRDLKGVWLIIQKKPQSFIPQLIFSMLP